MRVIATTLAFIIAAACGTAVTAQTCPPLRVRNPDGNYIVPGSQADIRYSGALSLDAYVQRGDARRPSVVVIHGGGWTAGSRTAHVGQLLELLTSAGFHWFSVDYRLGGVSRHEDALADLRTALNFIRCRGRDFGIDANQLVLLGEDSGAHLTALLASERPAGVIGAVLVGGSYDLAAIPALARDLPPDVAARASPIARIVPNMPPLLVVHGGADTETPAEQARRYCGEVIKATGRCTLVDVAGGSHRSENWWPSQWGYKREIVSWLWALTSRTMAAHEPRPGVVQKDIVYKQAPASRPLEPSIPLKLDAFIPRSARPVPAVIVVHGGGWEAGDKVTYVTPIFEPLARAGLAWFSIDYRLTPAFTHLDQLDDLRDAVAFVRTQHARFNIDPAKIFLLGESASGQMATLLATEDRSLAGVVSFYGVYDFPAMVTDASPRSLLVRLFRRTALDDASRELLRTYSPLYQVQKAMPPVLMVNGTGERLWPQAQAFAARLSELAVPYEVVAIANAPHGMENWEGRAEWMFYKSRVTAWILRRSIPNP